MLSKKLGFKSKESEQSNYYGVGNDAIEVKTQKGKILGFIPALKEKIYDGVGKELHSAVYTPIDISFYSFWK